MISHLKHFLRRLGLLLPEERTFQLDSDLMPSLEALARQARLSPDEMAHDLLAHALSQQQLQNEMVQLWETLTPRQQQVAALTCLGYTNDQMAARLHISPETVKTHVRNMLQKFGLHSKSQLRQLLNSWDFAAWDL